MNWLDESGPERRPLVFVEDHLYHTTDLLAEIRSARPDLASQITVAVLDRPGPDTDTAAAACAAQFPDVLVAIPSVADLGNTASFSKWVGRRLRPGGVLVQDVQLGTLPFIPADRWWESIYLAATIRGMFPHRAPAVRFLSNKRGYGATFGGEMADAGFDPRDVMEKSDLRDTVVPALSALFDRRFPAELECGTPSSKRRVPIAMTTDAERQDVERALDLVLWQQPHGLDLSGRAVAPPGRVGLKSGAAEADTWAALVAAHLNGQDGLAVVHVGARVGPPQAERAELTNLAARHIHTLRSRLRAATDIVTVNHAYRLNERLRAGVVRPRATFGPGGAPAKVTG